MRVSILPKSLLGWWSTALCIASILLFALFEVLLGPGPEFNMPVAYVLTAVLAGISIAVLVCGILSVAKRKERSILVFLSLVIGLYSLLGGVTALFGLQK